MTHIRLTMAQALIRFLDQQYFCDGEKEHKFIAGIMGIFGHGNVTGLGEALENEEHALPFIRGNNEQGLVHAATAFAKQHDRQKIMAVTSSIGPGATNMVTGAATATINRLPVLLLVGDIFSGRGPDPVLQQLEHPLSHHITVNDCFKPVSRYFDRIDRPEQLMTAMLKAMAVLSDPGQSGAVTICLPQDVQCEAFDYPEKFFKKRVHRMRRPSAEDWQIKQAVEMIKRSERPLIIAGGGVHYAKAAEALQNLAEKMAIPVAETQAGKSAILTDSPVFLGGLGVIGTRAANQLLNEADLVIAIGTRLADFVTSSNTFLKSQELISINIDLHDCNKLEPALSIQADALKVIEALDEALSKTGFKTSKIYLDEVNKKQTAWRTIRAQLFAQQPGEPFNQVQVLGCLNEQIHKNAVVVAAAGSLPGDLQRLWHAGSRKGYHLEYGYSCMGYEVAGGLGVKLAEPERDVWVMVGDGSFLMMHSEIVTALQEGLKINIVLFDSQGFNCIKSLQCAFGSQGYGTDLRFRNPRTRQLDGEIIPIDFSRYASALGLKTWAPRTWAALTTAIKEVEQCPSSTLIEVTVEPGSQSPGFDSYWKIAVSEVSKSPRVESIRAQQRIK